MASLLKNQILKHLSKFTKNLSSDKINLSAFKGEGELSNLELHEDVLTQLLELPTWLRITKAVCNRVSVKIQWTKLKSQPICLYLDEVIVETETCETPRAPNSLNQQLSGGKYGFVDRVMDGIYVHVNSVVVKLTSHKFQASLQLSRVKVQSMTPTWQMPNDLRSTRIRDSGLGEILLFKEIEWQTTRIEATALESSGEHTLTPLRLIANQAKIRIAVKKRLSDSAIISSRLTLLLDDLLWVLTITQLKAAILYGNSLKELIERSARQSKTLAAEKLKKQGHMQDQNARHQQHQMQQRSIPVDRQESSTAKYFSRFDVCSTSYHLVTSRFDLHLCDDGSPDAEEKRQWKIGGGSMQITFYKLSIDFYPFHPAGGERKSWHRYTDGIGTRNAWVQKLFAQFREDAVLLRKACESSLLTSSSSAPSLVSGPQGSTGLGKGTALKPGSSLSARTSPVHGGHLAQPPGSKSTNTSPCHQVQRSTRLLESCFVFKVEDMTVYMVNTPSQKRTGHQKLLSSDKKQLHLPPEMSMIHLEFTDYFFPEGLEYPVPSSNLYVLVNPVRVTLDFLSLLWSNVFLLTLSRSLDMDFANAEPSQHVDIKVELLMPRIIVPAEEKVDNQPDRPDALQLQVSKLSVTNCRTEERMTRDCLLSVLNEYESAHIFTQTEFPCEDLHADDEMIPKLLYQHASDEDNPFVHKDVKSLLVQDSKESSSEGLNHTLMMASPISPAPDHKLACDSLKRLASSDIWAFHAEQVWLEFLGIPNSRNRPVPFIEAIPVTIWISMSENVKQRKSTSFGIEKDNQSTPVYEKESQNARNGSHSSQQDASRSCAMPQSGMPTVGSPSPICDNDSHQIYNKDGVSPPDHHHKSSYQQSSAEDERRPSRPYVSGEHSSGDSSRRRKVHRRNDSPCEEKSRSSRSSHQYQSSSKSGKRSQSPSALVDYSSGNYADESGNRDQKQQQQHSTAYRQKTQFRREDSRSISSPPSGYRETGVGSKRGEELRGRGDRHRSQSGTRLVRQSSSSGSDRRDLEGGYRSGDGWRDGEGRTSAEGQVSLDWSRSEGERVRTREKRGSREELYDSGRDHSEYDPSLNHDSSRREFVSMNFRRNRQSSSSSNEFGPPTNPSSNKERLSNRSSSRDRRDRLHTLERQDIERRVPRDGSRENRDHNQDRRRRMREETPERSHSRGHAQTCVPKESTYPVNSQDHDNDVGFGRLGSQGRARDLKRLDGVSRSRESSLTRVRDQEQERPRRRRSSSSHADDLQDSGTRSSSRHATNQGSAPYDNDVKSCQEKNGIMDRDKRADWRYNQQEHPEEEFQRYNHKLGNHNDKSGHPVLSPSSQDQQQQQQSDRGFTRCNSRPTPEGCRSQDEYGQKNGDHLDSSHFVNKMCVLTSVDGKVRLQVTHFQYLFLMRLLESFAAFQLDLTADLSAKAETTSSIAHSHPHQSNFVGHLHHERLPQHSDAKIPCPTNIMFPLVLKEIELAVVCPYQMHQRTFSDDFSVISPFLTGLTTGHDAVFGEEGEATCFPQFVDGRRTKDDFNLQRAHQSISFKSNSSSQLEKLTHLNSPFNDAFHQRGRGLQPDTGQMHHQQPFSSTKYPATVNGTHFSTVHPDTSHGKESYDSLSQSACHSIGKDSGIGKETRSNHPPSRQQQHSGAGQGKSGKGASDMKKAFTSAFSSFTDKLKTKMEGFDESYGTDDFDTMSIRTDTSDDDFEHMSLEDLEEVPAFYHEHPPPDLQPTEDSYSEIIDPGDSVSMYAESSTTKGKEMVYIVLFKLDHTEVLSMLEDAGTIARVQLAKFSTVQLGNISYDDFQSRFSSARGYVQEDLAKVPKSSQTKPATSNCPIKIKYVIPVQDPNDPTPIAAQDPGKMTIRADDFTLQFKMSGLTCLSDFVEDEKFPDVVPMSLTVSNLLLVLEEDRPPANITSPGTLPLNFCVRQLNVERTRDGMMYLSGGAGGDLSHFKFKPSKPAPPCASSGPSQTSEKPNLVNATTSPMPGQDGTMALLMASQNETVLLRRQLEEVRRANRLYEHQILQWREMQDASSVAAAGGSSSSSPNTRVGFTIARKHQNFLGDLHTGSQSSSGISEATTSAMSNHVQQPLSHESDASREEIERENLGLQHRIVRLEDDLLTVSKEKESLLQTLQLLQDELLASERKQRAKSK